jgi:hypothetical protein
MKGMKDSTATTAIGVSGCSRRGGSARTICLYVAVAVSVSVDITGATITTAIDVSGCGRSGGNTSTICQSVAVAVTVDLFHIFRDSANAGRRAHGCFVTAIQGSSRSLVVVAVAVPRFRSVAALVERVVVCTVIVTIHPGYDDPQLHLRRSTEVPGGGKSLQSSTTTKISVLLLH